MKSEWVMVLAAAVGVLAYLAALFLVPALQGPARVYDLDGLRIYASQPPREALQTLFSQPNLRMRLDLFDGTDDRNRAVAAMGAEMAAAFASSGRQLGLYGNISGVPDGCDESNGNCTDANLIVRAGNCNCIRIGQELIVEGDPQFLKENTVKLRGIIKLVLADLQTTPSTSPTDALSALANLPSATELPLNTGR